MRLWPRKRLTYEQATPWLDETRRLLDIVNAHMRHARYDVSTVAGGWQAFDWDEHRRVGPVCHTPGEAARRLLMSIDAA